MSQFPMKVNVRTTATEFGKAVRAKREDLRTTDPTYCLRSCASKIGISPTHLSGLEQGLVIPRRDELVQVIGQVLDMDLPALRALAERANQQTK